MLKDYLRSVWKHWEKLLTGGSLMAIAAIWALTGNTIWPAVGTALVGATFFAAGFHAWKDERQKNAAAKTPRATIDEVLAVHGAFILKVHLENPTPEPVSFTRQWSLKVTRGDNGRTATVRGEMVGSIRPLQQADQFDVQLIFEYTNEIPDADALSAASLLLSGADITGNLLEAEYPRRA